MLTRRIEKGDVVLLRVEEETDYTEYQLLFRSTGGGFGCSPNTHGRQINGEWVDGSDGQDTKLPVACFCEQKNEVWFRAKNEDNPREATGEQILGQVCANCHQDLDPGADVPSQPRVKLGDLIRHGQRGGFAKALHTLYVNPDSRVAYERTFAVADSKNRAALEAALAAVDDWGSLQAKYAFQEALRQYFSGLSRLDETENPYSIPIRTPKEES